MVLIKAIAGAESAEAKGELEYYCKRFGLRHKAVVEIRKLRQQLTNEINLHEPGLSLTVDPKYVIACAGRSGHSLVTQGSLQNADAD